MVYMAAMAVVQIPDQEGYFARADGSILSTWYANGLAPHVIRPDLPMRMLAPRVHSRGYLRVSLGAGNDRYVHRLMWAAFNGPIPPGIQVRHWDGNKKNNAIENLLLGTQSDNEQDKYRHGTMPLGNDHFNAKLTEDLVREARGLSAQGVSLSKIKNLLGLPVSKAALHDAIRRKTWKHLI
jgi:hypothetical protein